MKAFTKVEYNKTNSNHLHVLQILVIKINVPSHLSSPSSICTRSNSISKTFTETVGLQLIEMFQIIVSKIAGHFSEHTNRNNGITIYSFCDVI